MSKPPKVPFSNLALLAWLCERPGRRLFSTSEFEISLYERGEADAEGLTNLTMVFPKGGASQAEDIEFIKRLGGRGKFDVSPLSRLGLVGSVRHGEKENEGRFKRARFHWKDHVYLLRKEGAAWFKEVGAALYEAALRDNERRYNEESRLIVIGARFIHETSVPDDLKRLLAGVPMPSFTRRVVRPYATARVTKTTAQRLYVEDVRKLTDDYFRYECVPISGREPNMYIPIEAVMLDHATTEGAARLAAVDAEYLEDFERIDIETMRMIAPILSEMASRTRQKEAEREEMLADLLKEAGQISASDDVETVDESTPRRR